MASAGDIINGSLRRLGVLAEGETPSAATSQDALTALNQMIDSWNTERLAVFSTQDLSYGIKIINQQQYNGIAVKTVTSSFPQVMWVNMTYPDIEMYVYPVPLRSIEFHFVSIEELTQPVNLATTLAFPPGYLRCFRYNLACEMAPEFGVEPSPQVKRIAMTSKRNLKRVNNPCDVMALPYSIVGTRQRYNIFAGNY